MSARFRGAYAAMAVGMLVLVLAAAQAQTPSPTGSAGEEQKGGRFKERYAELNLTPAQMEQLSAQRQANRSAMRELMRTLKNKNRELRDEIAKQSPDKDKLESITSEMKRLEAQRVDQRVKNILQIKETLKPEQFQKLSALEEELKTQRLAMQKLQKALKAKREDLREELDKQNPDKSRIESIANELKRLEAQRIDQKVKIMQMTKTLRPESSEGRLERERAHGDEQGEGLQSFFTQPEKPAGQEGASKGKEE